MFIICNRFLDWIPRTKKQAKQQGGFIKECTDLYLNFKDARKAWIKKKRMTNEKILSAFRRFNNIAIDLTQ